MPAGNAFELAKQSYTAWKALHDPASTEHHLHIPSAIHNYVHLSKSSAIAVLGRPLQINTCGTSEFGATFATCASSITLSSSQLQLVQDLEYG
jgi:hypothetical protein